MKTAKAVGPMLSIVLAVSACSGKPPVDPAASAVAEAGAAALAQNALEESNKKVVLEFFREGITPDERYELMHPDYGQHNPIFKKFGEINGTKGREEFKLLMQTVFSRPPVATGPSQATAGAQPPAGDPRYLVMAEGDVVTVLQKRFMPDPLKPGEFYEAFWYDTWRVKDGKLYEHWDPATIDANNIPAFLKAPVHLATP